MTLIYILYLCIFYIYVYIYIHTHTYIWKYMGFPSGLAVKNLPAMQMPQETQVQSLSQEYPLEEGMATHSSILSWRVPRTEEPGGLQSIGLQRVGHSWSSLVHMHAYEHAYEILEAYINAFIGIQLLLFICCIFKVWDIAVKCYYAFQIFYRKGGCEDRWGKFK